MPETTAQSLARRLRMVIFLMTIASLLTGCNAVRRRLTITSNPPGATVFVNDKEIGQTPISQNFIYSGTYKIRLTKEGMETKTVMHEVRTPWYLWPGVDFFSENFVPGELRDNQTCHVEMDPKRVIPNIEMVENAEKMRSEAHNQANMIQYQGTREGFVQPDSNTASTTSPSQNPTEKKEPTSYPMLIIPPRTEVTAPSNEQLAQTSTESVAQPIGYNTPNATAEESAIKNANYYYTTPSF